MDALAKSAVEPSTVRNYGVGMRRFAGFVLEICASLNVPPWPHHTARDLRVLLCSRGVLEAFVLYGFDEGLTSGTIDLYVSGVKFLASDWESTPSIPLPGVWMMKQMLKGITKIRGPQLDGILPIGMLKLRKILTHLDIRSKANGFDAIFWKTLFICAYYAAFRVSEYLVGEDTAKWLTCERVICREDGWICFQLFKTKNNIVGPMQPVLYPVLLNELTCPVTAIKNYMRVRKSTAPNAPFFIDFQGKPLSSGRFNEKLKRVMDEVEPELEGRFASKSFRMGATSDAFALNIPTSDIGNLGRWAIGSTAFMHYVTALSRAERAVTVRFALAEIGK